MSKSIFTFGYGHVHPVTKQPLDECYVVIESEDWRAAHEEMVRRFGREWCGHYQENVLPELIELGQNKELTGDAALGLLADVRAS